MVSLFRFPSQALQAKSESIGRAVDSLPASVQHMGLDHRRADFFVTQPLLDPPNIIPVLQEVGPKGVTKRKINLDSAVRNLQLPIPAQDVQKRKGVGVLIGVYSVR